VLGAVSELMSWDYNMIRGVFCTVLKKRKGWLVYHCRGGNVDD